MELRQNATPPDSVGQGLPAPGGGLRAARSAFVTYAACVSVLILVARALDERVPAGLALGVHAAVLAIACLLPVVGAFGRCCWSLMAAMGLPTVFSAVGLVLPALHPQPFEWRCIACDRWLFGCDPGVRMQAWLTPLAVEALQLAYATFYFLPVVVAVALAWRRRWREFEVVVGTVAVGFLLSYLGYYLFPTLPPYRYLDYGGDLVGLGFAQEVRRALDVLEANRFDCMPSGHTMMTLVTLELARRYTPRVFWLLLPVGALLVLATVALRYHYVVDLMAGALLVPVAFRATNWLLGAAAAPRALAGAG